VVLGGGEPTEPQAARANATTAHCSVFIIHRLLFMLSSEPVEIHRRLPCRIRPA
jgi:hypothetical protein